MARGDKGYLTVTQAVDHTGLSRRTVQRRAQAWADGDRSPYALKAGRTGGDRGDRVIDAVDAERVRLQRIGELPGTITAEQYAAMQAGEQ